MYLETVVGRLAKKAIVAWAT